MTVAAHNVPENYTGVVRLPAGNGVEFPFAAYVNGEMLRTSNGVGRRFKTEVAAQRAADVDPNSD